MSRLLVLILMIGSSFVSVSAVSPVTESSSGTFEWELSIPSLESIIHTERGIEFPNWNTTIDAFGHTIPVLSKLIYTQNGPPYIEIDIPRTESLILAHEGQFASETAKGIALISHPKSYTQDFFDVKLINSSSENQLWAINIYGAKHVSGDDSYILAKELHVTIQGGGPTAIQSVDDGLYLNKLPNIPLGETVSTLTHHGEGKFKLFILNDGIYRIYYDSLITVQDFPLEPIQSRSLILTMRGEQQPLYVYDHGDGLFDRGDYFDFIGIRNYSSLETQYYDPFSDLNIYWLDWGGSDGLRFIEESGALVEADPVRPTSFWDDVHIEKDSIFDRLGQVDTNLPTITRDHYFWNSVNSGQHEDVYFQLADPFRGSSENVSISIGLHGLTYSQTEGEEAEHTLFAFLNDYSIGEGNWTQQEEYVLESPASLNLSHNILSGGSNKLSIFAPVSTEAGNYDRIVLNWIEIGYEHLLTAHNDALRFRKSFINPETNLEFEIKGFSSHELVLYKEGLSKIAGYNIRKNWDSQSTQYSLVFQDEVTEATPDYWASSVKNLLTPVKIIADTSAALRQADGDLIVITIPEFVESLDEYLQFKTDAGWHPIVVSVADIYDEFNWGIHSPYAIKSFLTYARYNWPSKPEYAVLIGDAIADPQSTKQDARIQNIPTFYMQTYGWGAAEADYWYSLLNGDDYLPDINIGRLPCSDQLDLATTLEKLIRYGSGENYGAWQNELIMIAGFESTFKTHSEALLQDKVPKDYLPSRIFIDRDSEGQIFWGDTDSLIAQWNSGKLLINFLGHGGGAVWADRSLFVRDDINYLDPDTPPAFVTSMTCFTASFSQVRGLGEVVLTESPAGAVGWFGSSGVGWVINDYLMIQPLLRRLLEEHKTVGELINIARMEYYLASSSYGYLKPSMLFQYNYLGDPTTQLIIPQSAGLLTSDKAIYAHSDQIQLSYIGEETGTLTMLPINASGHPWYTTPSSYETDVVTNYLFSQEDSVTAGESRTVYTLDRGPLTTAQHGFVSYSVSNDWFEHRPPTAADLALSDTISLRTIYHSSQFIADSLVVTFSGSNSATYDLSPSNGWWELSDTVRLSAGSGNTYYSFTAYFSGTRLLNSPTYRLYLPKDISLRINKIEEGYSGNRCGWNIEYSLSGLDQGIAQLDHQENGSGFSQHIVKNISIREGQQTFFIPSYFGSGEVDLITSIKIAGDANETDNNYTLTATPEYLQILPDIGLTRDGQTSDSLVIWSNSTLSGSALDTVWIRVQPDNDPIDDDAGITFYADSTRYTITASNNDINLSIHAPQPLFIKPSDMASWQILYNEGSGFSLRRSGRVAMGQKQDYTGPSVSMMMEGQLFFDGDYLLKDSRLNLLAEDINGFTWDSEDVQVLVDAAPVGTQYGDTSGVGQIISVMANLDLDVGRHDISYRIRDALGNWSDKITVSGTVSDLAKIIVYGNFPNPFEGETLIIYELTQPLANTMIEIFTISGYKIHVIDSFNAQVSNPLGAIGYHEIPWNGRDRLEQFVANGVYFYRIKGELNGGELVSPVGKMVKNR